MPKQTSPNQVWTATPVCDAAGLQAWDTGVPAHGIESGDGRNLGHVTFAAGGVSVPLAAIFVPVPVDRLSLWFCDVTAANSTTQLELTVFAGADFISTQLFKATWTPAPGDADLVAQCEALLCNAWWIWGRTVAGMVPSVAVTMRLRAMFDRSGAGLCCDPEGDRIKVYPGKGVVITK